MIQNKNVFAAIIGIGNYEEMNIANLPTYKMDLAMIGTALETGLKVPSDHIRIIAGEDHNGYVSTTALAHSIADFKSMLGSEDVFVFYFSGHGRDKNLVFSNGQVELQSVINYINTLPAKSKLVILDCCYSGNFKSAGARIMHFEESMAEFAGKGIAVLASSSADEVSRLGPKGNHSMFTGALSSAIHLTKKTRQGRLYLNDIYDETMHLVRAWNQQNPAKAQQPIFRSSIGGTISFQVEEYHPYKQMEVRYEAPESRLIRVKPLSTGLMKRLAAFVLTDRETEYLPMITREVADRIKYAEVYQNEQSEQKLEGIPARVIWVYFGRDESDILNSLHFAYTIWAADDETKNIFYRENRNASVIDGIYVYENPSYDVLKKLQQPTKSRKQFITDNKKLLALIVTLAERFIFDFQEVSNQTLTIETMQERYGDWIIDVRRNFIRLSDEDIPPDDLHEWSEAIMDLAGWVSDMSLLMENRRGGGVIGEDEKWLINNSVRRYYEAMDRIKKAEEEIEW